MARFNESMQRDPARRATDARKASLASRGVDLASVMAETGLGERRAMAEAERRLNIHWHVGVGECGACHLPGAPK